MTPTKEGNKLIGDFMGKDFKDPLNYMYNKSWDWLMPVVEKIEDFEIDEIKAVAVDIESNECEIKDYRQFNLSFAYYEGETKIEAVWQCVIQFIQWYNQQNQKQ